MKDIERVQAIENNLHTINGDIETTIQFIRADIEKINRSVLNKERINSQIRELTQCMKNQWNDEPELYYSGVMLQCITTLQCYVDKLADHTKKYNLIDQKLKKIIDQKLTKNQGQVPECSQDSYAFGENLYANIASAAHAAGNFAAKGSQSAVSTLPYIKNGITYLTDSGLAAVKCMVPVAKGAVKCMVPVAKGAVKCMVPVAKGAVKCMVPVAKGAVKCMVPVVKGAVKYTVLGMADAAQHYYTDTATEYGSALQEDKKIFAVDGERFIMYNLNI